MPEEDLAYNQKFLLSAFRGKMKNSIFYTFLKKDLIKMAMEKYLWQSSQR